MNTEKFDRYDEERYLAFTSRSVVEREMNTLIGIISGITSDKVINPAEFDGLRAWGQHLSSSKTREPFRSILMVVQEAISDNCLTSEEVKNIKWLAKQYSEASGYFWGSTVQVQELYGLINGIAFDRVINDKEITYLDNWLEKSSNLRNCWPYDELYTLVTKILADKLITAEEHDELLRFCTSLRYDAKSNKAMYDGISAGYCQVDPQIDLQEKSFCITGVSLKMKRRAIAERIELYGGVVVNHISKDLNYLVVCDERNSCWAFTCYGRKVEKAVKYRREENAPIAIIHEADLHDHFESFR